jgi:hypothetical protein
VSAAVVAVGAELAEAIVGVLVEQVGVPLLLRLVAARAPAEQRAALMQAELDAIRAAADAEARVVLGAP